jgi:hypothetical protein
MSYASGIDVGPSAGCRKYSEEIALRLRLRFGRAANSAGTNLRLRRKQQGKDRAEKILPGAVAIQSASQSG